MAPETRLAAVDPPPNSPAHRPTRAAPFVVADNGGRIGPKSGPVARGTNEKYGELTNKLVFNMNCYCNRKNNHEFFTKSLCKIIPAQKKWENEQEFKMSNHLYTVYHKKNGDLTENVVVLSTAIKIYISEPKTRFSKTEMRNFLEEKRT